MFLSRPTPTPPGPGQESVWSYPRPPRLEPTPRRLQVFLGRVCVADTTSGWRVLETSHPPVYYLPPQDLLDGALVALPRTSVCEWKGVAAYCDVVADGLRAQAAAWRYTSPEAAFAPIANHVAFYAWAMTRCLVDGIEVTPQPGRFYGGWITPDVVGPFKGEPGSMGW